MKGDRMDGWMDDANLIQAWGFVPLIVVKRGMRFDQRLRRRRYPFLGRGEEGRDERRIEERLRLSEGMSQWWPGWLMIPRVWRWALRMVWSEMNRIWWSKSGWVSGLKFKMSSDQARTSDDWIYHQTCHTLYTHTHTNHLKQETVLCLDFIITHSLTLLLFCTVLTTNSSHSPSYNTPKLYRFSIETLDQYSPSTLA